MPSEKSNRYWARLLAKIYEVFPLECECGEGMKIVAFITSPHLAKGILARLKMLIAEISDRILLRFFCAAKRDGNLY